MEDLTEVETNFTSGAHFIEQVRLIVSSSDVKNLLLTLPSRARKPDIFPVDGPMQSPFPWYIAFWVVKENHIEVFSH